jgi:hypothetical protein
MVLNTLLPPRDNQKRYRFTPPVSNWRMLEAVSVDALCGFGAKNFIRCTYFTQSGPLASSSESLVYGHFGAGAAGVGSVVVRFGNVCHISGRILTPVVTRA